MPQMAPMPWVMLAVYFIGVLFLFLVWLNFEKESKVLSSKPLSKPHPSLWLW